jgi:hypothetical protein
MPGGVSLFFRALSERTGLILMERRNGFTATTWDHAVYSLLRSDRRAWEEDGK